MPVAAHCALIFWQGTDPKAEGESAAEQFRFDAVESRIYEQYGDMKRDYSSGAICLADDRYVLVRAKRAVSP